MTVRKKFEEMLFEHGMFEYQASAVMQSVIDDPVYNEINVKWDDDVSVYPKQLYAIIWLTVKQAALKWIDTNKPQAWYRACFVD